MLRYTSTPKLPKLSTLGLDLLQLTRFQKLRVLATPFVVFVAYWILSASGHWILAFLSLVVLSFVTYGSTSHDLVHDSLHLPRRWNDLLLCIIELMGLRSGHAYQLAHLHHHARFPHDDDIEGAAAHMSFRRALLEGFIFQWKFLAWALRNPKGKQTWIRSESVLIATLIITAIAAIPWAIQPIVYVVVMIAGGWILPLMTSYIPHDGQSPDALQQTRIFRGLVARCLFLDHLYHWEHHCYPAVPHQNWPRLARRLDPWIKQSDIKPIRIGF